MTVSCSSNACPRPRRIGRLQFDRSEPRAAGAGGSVIAEPLPDPRPFDWEPWATGDRIATGNRCPHLSPIVVNKPLTNLTATVQSHLSLRQVYAVASPSLRAYMGQMIRGDPRRQAGALAFEPGQRPRHLADICMRPRRCRDAGAKRRSMMDLISAGKAPVSHACQDKGDELPRIGD